MVKPNFILIQSNRHRWESLGYAGNDDVHTPNLDALAAHGVSFDEARGGSSPMSAQAKLMTGAGLPMLERPLVPGLLKGAGYKTGFAGKLYFAVSELCDAFDGVRSQDKGGGNVSDSVTRTGNLAVRFVQHAPQPFYLHVCFDEPRPPFAAPEQWRRLYEHLHAKELSDYYGLVSIIDKQIGRILATLSARAITNNVVIYCAASGAASGAGGTACDDRVPLIVAGLPDRRRGRGGGKASLADVPAIILQAAGVKVPPRS